MTSGSTGTEDRTDAEDVARLVRDLATATSGTPADLRRLTGLLRDRYAGAPRRLHAGVDAALVDAVAEPAGRGWDARDLVEIVRRRVGTAAAPLACDAVAAEDAQRPRGARPDLVALGAVVWWDRARPLVTQWSSERGLSEIDALGRALAIVHALRTLPTLPTLATPADAAAASGVDQRVLARVRGLLAKAESTSFPEEAEALSAKAQELMGRHALERAVVDRGTEREAAPATARRIWLESPYASAKAHLVHQVAIANRCRAVSLDALDMVTVVGHPTDLDAVELLVTSLLVQADRAMLAEGSGASGEHADRGATGKGSGTRTSGGRSRTRSFRHAFLLSYATRVGERLAEAAREAQARARAEVGERLLPVLAARAEVVEATVAELFPRITTRRATVGNAAGWNAGRAAADAARLAPERGLLDG